MRILEVEVRLVDAIFSIGVVLALFAPAFVCFRDKGNPQERLLFGQAEE